MAHIPVAWATPRPSDPAAPGALNPHIGDGCRASNAKGFALSDPNRPGTQEEQEQWRHFWLKFRPSNAAWAGPP